MKATEANLCHYYLSNPLECDDRYFKAETNLGRWGNGDVEVDLKSLDELPYVMGLVRQPYELQMGDGGQT